MTRVKQMGWRALAAALAVLALLAGPAGAAAAERFSFGVMSDTQWKANLDGENPGTVAVGIVRQLNEEFVRHEVKFVIQVGDLGDTFGATSPSLQTRAAEAEALYAAGIGFFPLRGNHESSQSAALKFQELFPQARGLGEHVVGATAFSSPMATLDGLSYAFDYGNARFVLIDQFTRTDGTSYLGSSNNNAIDQLPWISSVLASKPADRHSFVFAHKGLITENHVDTLFGTNPAANPDAQNAFIGSLFASGTRYFFGGHDHMHNRALVLSPNLTASVQDVTTSSNSYKFYIPRFPSVDETYNTPRREIPLAQELFTVGYYIVTVDGPRVTVDHYAAPNGCEGDCDLTTTPALAGKFTKRDTFGYSLNGKEFLVRPGEAYAVVADEHEGTSAAIVDGVNGSDVVLHDGRPVSHLVTTGWSERACGAGGSTLHLWGMATEMGSDRTDAHAVAVSFDPQYLRAEAIGIGGFGLVAKRADGAWVNAVELNSGGTPEYVVGPYRPGYGLGTYGIDPARKTAWAVVDSSNAQLTVTNFEAAKSCR